MECFIAGAIPSDAETNTPPPTKIVYPFTPSIYKYKSQQYCAFNNKRGTAILALYITESLLRNGLH
jgi:hypothetical protein